MMEEMNDYSGEFKPNLKLSDFSKETLLRLLTAYARCYPGMDGLWFSLCRERFGDEVARELDEEIWANRALVPEANRICERSDIRHDFHSASGGRIQKPSSAGSAHPGRPGPDRPGQELEKGRCSI